MVRTVLVLLLLAVAVASQPDPESSSEETEDELSPQGCHYEGQLYAEGELVSTDERCLHCRCRRGSLVCYLRVCQDLPLPPPPGCIIVHRRKSCCPELICDTGTEMNRVDRRNDGTDVTAQVQFSGPDSSSITTTERGIGCLKDGTLYAEGSAMMTSSLCEHCFCIKGKQRCVQPKCLLPLEGCSPHVNSATCCPTKYNCSEAITSTTTTTSAPTPFTGCEVDREYYPEGAMVTSVARPCENCFCMKGKVRCTPLLCSPPMLGCIPIVRSGDCCPTEYNCTYSTRVFPEQLSGRKETKLNEDQPDYMNENARPDAATTMLYPLEDVLERNAGVIPVYSKSHDPQGIQSSGQNENEVFQARSNTDTFPDVSKLHSQLSGILSHNPKQPPQVLSERIANDLEANETAEVNEGDTILPVTTELYLEQGNETITTNIDDHDIETVNTTVALPSTAITQTPIKSTSPSINSQPVSVTNTSDVSKIDGGFGDKLELRTDSNELETMTFATEGDTTTIVPPTASATEDPVTVHADSSSNGTTTEDSTFPPVPAIPPEIEAILNITHKGDEDYEYDYNEPSLPPSLPNLKIIPFVAADAVVEQGQSSDSHRTTQNPLFFDGAHMFSPPVETQGGFVPRQPPILKDPFYVPAYDTPYASLGVNAPLPPIPPEILAAASGTTTVAPTSAPDDDRCVSEGRTYGHGELISKPDPCVLCLCYYGDVLCQETKCPPVNEGCERQEKEGYCCGPIVCPTTESPAIDRADVTTEVGPLGFISALKPHLGVPAPTVAEGVITPDPFKDVIKTEPAPDLPSLINQMVPFLFSAETTTTTKPSTTESLVENITEVPHIPEAQVTPMPIAIAEKEVENQSGNEEDLNSEEEADTNEEDSGFSLNSVLELLFPSGGPTFGADDKESPFFVQLTSTTTEATTTSRPTTRRTTTIGSAIFVPNFPETVTKPTSAPAVQRPITTTLRTPEFNHPDSINSVHLPLYGDPVVASGMLKLAGCNIYGRMYRVGRIISELSGPCMECRCTEIGVQCKPLVC